MNSDGRVRVDSEFLFFLSLLLLSGNFHHTRLHTHNTLQVPMADKQDNKKKNGNPLTTIFSLFLFLFLFLTTLFLTNQIKSDQQTQTTQTTKYFYCYNIRKESIQQKNQYANSYLQQSADKIFCSL